MPWRRCLPEHQQPHHGRISLRYPFQNSEIIQNVNIVNAFSGKISISQSFKTWCSSSIEQSLTPSCLGTYKYVIVLDRRRFMSLPGACSVPIYYLNQWRFVINWGLKKNLQWNLNQNTSFRSRNYFWKCRQWNRGYFFWPQCINVNRTTNYILLFRVEVSYHDCILCAIANCFFFDQISRPRFAWWRLYRFERKCARKNWCIICFPFIWIDVQARLTCHAECGGLRRRNAS